MSKLTILAAAGVGYVLGARAGRERYEQLRESFEKVKNDPRVQEKAHQVADAVKEQAPVVAEAVKEKAGEAAGAAGAAAQTAKDKASGSSSAGSGTGSNGTASSGAAAAEAEADGSLNPDRIRLTDDGPQGTLP